MSSPEKKYRWHQIRLRFLVLAIPLGGLALAWPWAETQRLESDAQFDADLQSLFTYVQDREDIHRLLKRVVARRVNIARVPVWPFTEKDRTAVLEVHHGDLITSSYLLEFNDDRIVTGVIALSEDWHAGRPPPLDPEVARVRDFLLVNDAELSLMKVEEIIYLLKGRGFEVIHMDAYEFKGRLNDRFCLAFDETWTPRTGFKPGKSNLTMYWTIVEDFDWDPHE